MKLARRILLLVASSLVLLGLASCGNAAENDVAVGAQTVPAPVEAASSNDAGDEDHGDDDHGDEDHDGDDHGDEDHDGDDHGDEDHDGDDHGDEDHDDEDGASGGFDAHVHGEAELFVAWAGGEMVVDLISPADNIFGFEYEPTTDADREIVADRTAALTEADVLVFNSEAACDLVDGTSNFSVDGGHAEVTASWTFSCDNADDLQELDASNLFAEFPGILDLDVQWASESQQSAAELSPASTVVAFE